MAKFNNKHTDRTTNYEGADALRLSPEYELYCVVATSMIEDTFYEDKSSRINRISSLVAQCDTGYVARLAVYARTCMHLRSVPMLLLVELARKSSGESILSRAVAASIKRADEICELLACYALRNPSNKRGDKALARLSNQLSKGLKRAFNNFDEYQFAKYKNHTSSVSLRDALFLVHPSPKDSETQLIFNKIASNSLPTPYTWETSLSEIGQRPELDNEQKTQEKARAWTSLIESGKLGYMALLRNLRNILRLGKQIPESAVDIACEILSNPRNVRNSQLFPFRFYSAYKEIRNYPEENYKPKILTALESALKASSANIRGFEESSKVLIACDVSGSMNFPLSSHSAITGREVGLLLAMLLRERCKDATIGLFGSIWKTITPPQGILAGVAELEAQEYEIGYATNGYLVLRWLIENNIKQDKILLFTDCQLWQSLTVDWHRYTALYPDAKIYLFDIQGYGNIPFETPEKNVFLIAGWSDKIFDMLEAIESGEDALEKIHALTL